MKMILTGDVNLMNVTDPAIPFAFVRHEFRAAEAVFCNLECCLHQPPNGHSSENEGFFADPVVAGEALASAGVQAVELPTTSIMARRQSPGRSTASTSSGSPIPAPERTGRSRGLRRSSSGVGRVLAFCSAARSIGQPITRRERMPPGLP